MRWYHRLLPTRTKVVPELAGQPNGEAREEPLPLPLPAGYIDLRYKGMGFVLDTGWRRSEEGMRWEVEEWRRTRRRTGQTQETEKENGKEKANVASRWGGGWIERIPFVRSW